MDQRNFWKGNYRLPGSIRGTLCFEIIKVISYIFAVDTILLLVIHYYAKDFMFFLFKGKVKKPRSTKFTHVIDPDNTMAVSQKTVTLTLQSLCESDIDMEETSTVTSNTSSSTVHSTPSTQPR